MKQRSAPRSEATPKNKSLPPSPCVLSRACQKVILGPKDVSQLRPPRPLLSIPDQRTVDKVWPMYSTAQQQIILACRWMTLNKPHQLQAPMSQSLRMNMSLFRKKWQFSPNWRQSRLKMRKSCGIFNDLLRHLLYKWLRPKSLRTWQN